MKTIEEKAIEYANRNPHGMPFTLNAYVAGATEQKEILIEKLKWTK